MAENKTKPTKDSITGFLATVASEEMRKDCKAIIAMMKSVSNKPPVLWGSAIIGFGTRHYVYDSGREGDTMLIGFSPRKAAITFYLACEVGKLQEELSALGKYTTGKGCLYIKSLADVDTAVLKKILAKAYAHHAS